MSHQTPLDELIDSDGDYSFTQVIFDAASPCYSSDEGEGDSDAEHSGEKAFQIDVTDYCASNGRVVIDVAPAEGDVDNALTLEVSVARLPGSDTSVPRVVIGTGLSGRKVSFYQVGDSLVMFDSAALSTTLNDGPNDAPPRTAKPYFGVDDA